ncbi:MAG: hypothetical protein L0H53_07090 [Candidatus Nitrosocosmicus sp.]|nr:hypothetical protein [Candidatus Nitrosocosmicus sp.]MDN5866874.1 hypothetical protein [Candidatus Nitrosocosmicus sp.]
MIELSKVERGNKVYVNDKVIVLDRDTITASELLEMAGFSSLVYDIYLIQNKDKKNKKANKPIIENKINIETGMRFVANLKSNYAHW